MKYIDPPVTEKTLNNYFGNIKRASDSGLSTIAVFQEGIGGSTAWISYLRDNKSVLESFFPRNKYYSTFINCISSIEMSKHGFLFNLLSQLYSDGTFDYRDVSINSMRVDIKSKIESLLKRKRIIIFITKFSEVNDFVKHEIDSILYELICINPQKISVVMSLSYDLKKNKIFGLWDELPLLKSYLSKNIIKFENHKLADIEFGLKRLVKNRSMEISDHDFKTLVNLFDRSFGRLKLLANHYALEKNMNDVLTHNNLLNTKEIKTKSSISIDGDRFICGDSDVSYLFTINQKRVLHLFIENQGEIISRDQVAKAIWGHDFFEKYSDWAIDRHISDIRQRLVGVNCVNKIKAIRGQGYIFSK